MLNFTFQNPTKVIFGKNTLGLIPGEIPRTARVMVTYGSTSAKKYGALDEVKTALEGYDLIEFGGIEPNPEYETLLTGISLIREKRVDFLLAIGGGSVIDGTKFMAAAASFTGAPFLLLENAGSAITRSLPVGAVATLPASGSEMNSRAIITRRATMIKRGIMNPLL